MNNTEFLEAYNKHKGMIIKIVSTSFNNLPNTSILEKEDLTQICSHVLWKCLEGFDPNRKTKFSTYLYTSLHSKMGRILKYEWKKYNEWNTNVIGVLKKYEKNWKTKI